MPRNDDKLYLTDMVMAADDIAEFIIYGYPNVDKSVTLLPFSPA